MYNYTDYYSSAFATFIWAILTVHYLISVYPMYVMYKRANLKNPWFAFIPGIGGLKMFNLVNLSMWCYLGLIAVTLIPFLGVIVAMIFGFYCCFKICQNFGLGLLGCILGIFFPIFVYWYIVLTNKPFIAEANPKFTN